MKFNNPPHTGTYYLAPLKQSGTKLTGTVTPPNAACPGKLSGTLKKGKLQATITYPGTPCSQDHLSMKGKMSTKNGTTSGTFTSNYYCAGKCTYSGKRTS
jgi:hypothetical protein